jgi:thymidylate kinase
VRHLGRLYVFEGPDGVGKTELSARLATLLRSQGIPTQLAKFPGDQDGTLGKLVYDLHHRPERFGVGDVAASSIQLMHIAAHLDAIERTILPALNAGTTVVLDRFWWSTRVYGLASGIDRKTLDAMLEVERAAWGGAEPTRIFLVRRAAPLRSEPEFPWRTYTGIYDQLANDLCNTCRMVIVDNNGPIEAAMEQVEGALPLVDEEVLREETSQMGLQFGPPCKAPAAPYVFSGLAPAEPTEVYDTYWKFAAERQRIFFRRFRGLPPPWTNDPILAQYKFTNAYRASDRVSQYLIREVIYRGSQSPEEVFFRTVLFKLFNKIETWELLTRSLGEITYREFAVRAYDQVLQRAMARGDRIYSAAYIMPSGSTAFGSTRKHRSHLELLERMMNDEVPLRLVETSSMFDAFKLLRSYPMMGDFLAYQYATDINYSTLTEHSETEVVVPGPGAKAGISKCFKSLGGLNEADLVRVVTERQAEEFERVGVDFETLWGRPLHLIDCQNLFCEVDKYARVRHPEYSGSSQRTRIKQKFRAHANRLDLWYPPKWGINGAIERERTAILRPGLK